eukprot:1553752-Pyramimonas_sp.AAC.1
MMRRRRRRRRREGKEVEDDKEDSGARGGGRSRRRSLLMVHLCRNERVRERSQAHNKQHLVNHSGISSRSVSCPARGDTT